MIEFNNVSVKYSNGEVALDGISLRIEAGEFVFIVGHSGAGKTTITKVLLGERKITSGSLRVDGMSLRSMRKSDLPLYRRKIGIVFQDFRLIERKTVFENIALPLRIVGKSAGAIRKRVRNLLSIVGLEHKENCFPKEMSGGEQQRVAFLRAIAANPDIVIADEPTGNVDRELAYQLFELLDIINKKGKTVIVVTHDMELVNKFVHRTVTIEGGKVTNDTVAESGAVSGK